MRCRRCPARDVLGVVAVGEDVLALLAHDDGGAGVLAHGQHAGGGDDGVLSRSRATKRSLSLASGSSRILRELGEVGRPEVVGDIVNRGLGQQPQRLGLDLQEPASRSLDHAHPLCADQTVFRLIRSQGKQVGVVELGHRLLDPPCGGAISGPPRGYGLSRTHSLSPPARSARRARRRAHRPARSAWPGGPGATDFCRFYLRACRPPARRGRVRKAPRPPACRTAYRAKTAFKSVFGTSVDRSWRPSGASVRNHRGS